jgi:hypothetical protein
MSSSHNILTLDALQVLSRSQVTPGLSMSMRIRPICKVYIHTSSHEKKLAWWTEGYNWPVVWWLASHRHRAT